MTRETELALETLQSWASKQEDCHLKKGRELNKVLLNTSGIMTLDARVVTMKHQYKAEVYNDVKWRIDDMLIVRGKAND